MGRFAAEEGLIHFIFANEDRYFKDSLICLNLSQNLYYELKEKGYKTVYFISMSGDKYRMTCADTLVSELYDAGDEKGFFSVFKKKKEFLNRLLKMMKTKDGKAAYVFTIDAFDTFVGSEKEFKDLEYNNYKYNNLILIKAPVEAEGSMKYFSNPDSIYRTDLFPDIQNIFACYENARLYEKMKKAMNSRISYMNELNQNELENMVRYTILNENVKINVRLPFVEDYAVCLWYLYHSLKFRNWVKREYSYLNQQFPVNPKRSFSVIEEAMKKDTSYRMLDGIILKIRQKANNFSGKIKYLIPDVLELDDYKDEHQEFLFYKNNMWDQLSIISYDFLDEDTKHSVEKKMEKIRKVLLTPCVNRDEDAHMRRKEYMNLYLNAAGNAESRKDAKSLVYAIDALEYVICKCGEEILIQKEEDKKAREDVEKSCLDCYKYILSYQKDIFTNREILGMNREQLDKQVKKWKLYLDSIKDMESKVPDLYEKAKAYMTSEDGKSKIPTKYANFFEEYWKQRRIASELGKHIGQRKNVVSVAEEKLLWAQQMVNELDVNLSGISVSDSAIFSKKITATIENISVAFDNVKEEILKTSKIPKAEFEGMPKSLVQDFEVELHTSEEELEFLDETYEKFDFLLDIE